MVAIIIFPPSLLFSYYNDWLHKEENLIYFTHWDVKD